jgi:hypothetical protein
METDAQHGTHRTDLVVDNERGVILCQVCGRDIALLAPEWLEHNTDVEGE